MTKRQEKDVNNSIATIDNPYFIYETPGRIVVLIKNEICDLMERVGNYLGADEASLNLFENVISSDWGRKAANTDSANNASSFCLSEELPIEEYRCRYYSKYKLTEYNIDRELFILHIKTVLATAEVYYRYFYNKLKTAEVEEDYEFRIIK